MDDWEKFNEAILPRSHDLYIRRDLLLLAGVFENLRKMCFEVYKLDLVKFISVSELAW